MLPISYSVGGEWLHRAIASYKRDADPSVGDAIAVLTTICERFVAVHERCLAAEAGVAEFDLVTTVPSGAHTRDVRHPLRRIVGQLMETTRDRHQRLLRRSAVAAVPRAYDPARYVPTRRLHGEAVLLIDDMWTSGASAQSAAAVLLEAGAGVVAAIVIARHLNRGWSENDARLRTVAARGFGFERCALCDRSPASTGVMQAGQSLGTPETPGAALIIIDSVGATR